MDTFFSTKTKTSEAFAKEKQELRLHQSYTYNIHIHRYNSQRGLLPIRRGLRTFGIFKYLSQAMSIN